MKKNKKNKIKMKIFQNLIINNKMMNKKYKKIMNKTQINKTFKLIMNKKKKK